MNEFKYLKIILARRIDASLIIKEMHPFPPNQTGDGEKMREMARCGVCAVCGVTPQTLKSYTRKRKKSIKAKEK